MRFWKEYLIIIIILVFVFTANSIFEKKLTSNINWMLSGLISVENKLSEGNEKEAQDEFYELKDGWMTEDEKLSLFVEHGELEQVGEKISIIDSNFSRNELDELYENIAELKYILKRIEEKNKLKLKNIL